MSEEKKYKKERSPFSAFVRYEDDLKSGKVDPKRSNYGNYLFGSAFEDPSDLDGTEPVNWTSYTTGRVGIRLFSRGIMGATLYTLAHRWIPGQLAGYNHMAKWSEMPGITQKPLQYVAKAWDSTAAPLVRGYVRALSPAEKAEKCAHDATWFRSKNDFGMHRYIDGVERKVKGRSLGAEITGMTFDFAMGSVGDSWGRNIAAIADPNRPNSWYKDGKMDWGGFTKSMAASAWDIISLKQGEDWAAALPYVYQMRWQRQAINKMYPGFKLSADRQLNGGSWRMAKDGRIIGSYSKAGALDLQLRFTGYNWYTLMYRDMYRNISDGWHAFKDHDYHLPGIHMPDSPLHAALDTVAHTFRYAVKSAIKATIYMTPAVPFFWVTRTPQTKYRGVGVVVPPHDLRNQGGLVNMGNGHAFSFQRTDPSFAGESITGYHDFAVNDALYVGRPLRRFPTTTFNRGFDPYSKATVRGSFDAMLNPFGRGCYKAGEALYRLGQGLGMSKGFAHDFANAAASYTPYMIAKAETALRWDRPGKNGVNLMDNAIYRMLDGVTSLSVGEVRAGFHDIREQVINPPTNIELTKLTPEDEEEMEHDFPTESKPATTVSQVQKKDEAVDVPIAAQQEAAKQDSWQGKYRIELDNDLSAPSGTTIH